MTMIHQLMILLQRSLAGSIENRVKILSDILSRLLLSYCTCEGNKLVTHKWNFPDPWDVFHGFTFAKNLKCQSKKRKRMNR